MDKERFLYDLMYLGFIAIRSGSVGYGVREDEVTETELEELSKLNGDIADMLHNIPHIIASGCEDKRINLEIYKINMMKDSIRESKGIRHVTDILEHIIQKVERYEKETK